jgi:hypothetical protein
MRTKSRIHLDDLQIGHCFLEVETILKIKAELRNGRWKCHGEVVWQMGSCLPISVLSSPEITFLPGHMAIQNKDNTLTAKWLLQLGTDMRLIIGQNYTVASGIFLKRWRRHTPFQLFPKLLSGMEVPPPLTMKIRAAPQSARKEWVSRNRNCFFNVYWTMLSKMPSKLSFTHIYFLRLYS